MPKTSNIRCAIIPVAGLGTRLLPLSRVIPKELIPLHAKPVVQHLVEECYRAGIREIIFIVSKRNRDLLRQYFDASHAEYMHEITNPSVQKRIADLKVLMKKMQFRYVIQEKPLGDGHAILMARRFIKRGEQFFASMGDLLVESRKSYIKEMANAAKRYGGYVTAVDPVHPHHVSRYGIIDPGRRLGVNLVEIKRIVEKPKPEESPSNFALIGKYIMDTGIFRELMRTKPDARGEIKLAYALDSMLKRSKPQLIAYKITGRHFDCGDWDGLKVAVSQFKPSPPLA